MDEQELKVFSVRARKVCLTLSGIAIPMTVLNFYFVNEALHMIALCSLWLAALSTTVFATLRTMSDARSIRCAWAWTVVVFWSSALLLIVISGKTYRL